MLSSLAAALWLKTVAANSRFILTQLAEGATTPLPPRRRGSAGYAPYFFAYKAAIVSSPFFCLAGLEQRELVPSGDALPLPACRSGPAVWLLSCLERPAVTAQFLKAGAFSIPTPSLSTAFHRSTPPAPPTAAELQRQVRAQAVPAAPQAQEVSSAPGSLSSPAAAVSQEVALSLAFPCCQAQPLTLSLSQALPPAAACIQRQGCAQSCRVQQQSMCGQQRAGLVGASCSCWFHVACTSRPRAAAAPPFSLLRQFLGVPANLCVCRLPLDGLSRLAPGPLRRLPGCSR